MFVIWFGSCIGATLPVFANQSTKIHIPAWMFFAARYFGSGVIIASAYIHLLSPAEDALRDPCLSGPITDYDWVSGIILMTIFVLCLIEMMAIRYGIMYHSQASQARILPSQRDGRTPKDAALSILRSGKVAEEVTSTDPEQARSVSAEREDEVPLPQDHYRAQLVAIFILEFGIIFHSIFIGLTLAVAGDEFPTLYVVIVFHQTFEGLGLGSRLAVSPWPENRAWLPYLLGVAYSLSTPISVAIGLGLKQTYAPSSQTTLIVNGIFDSVSAGILIYTGLIELIARDFIFNNAMYTARLTVLMSAFGIMALGAGLMALLGKWA